MDYFNAGQQIEIQRMDGFTPKGYHVFNLVISRPEILNELNDDDIKHLNGFFNLIENYTDNYTDNENPDPNPDDPDDSPVEVTELLPLNERVKRVRNRIRRLRELDPRLEQLELKGGRHHKKSKRRKSKRRKSKRRKSRRRNRIHH
jgi:hypothetical protein